MVAFTTGRPVTGRRGVKAGLKAEADPQNTDNQLATKRKSIFRAGRRVNERACNGIKPAPQVLRKVGSGLLPVSTSG
jgi:hypothetical protein